MPRMEVSLRRVRGEAISEGEIRFDLIQNMFRILQRPNRGPNRTRLRTKFWNVCQNRLTVDVHLATIDNVGTFLILRWKIIDNSENLPVVVFSKVSHSLTIRQTFVVELNDARCSKVWTIYISLSTLVYQRAIQYTYILRPCMTETCKIKMSFTCNRRYHTFTILLWKAAIKKHLYL